MVTKFVIILSLAAAGYAGLVPVSKVVHAEPEAPAHYDFSYSVHDDHSGDVKQQQESREGDAVHGSYSLVQPDGVHRIVDYTADKVHGFNANVRYEGTPVHPAPAKIAYAAPVAKVAYAPTAVSYAHAPVSYSHAPVSYSHAPVAYAAPVAKLAYAAPVAKVAYAPAQVTYSHAPSQVQYSHAPAQVSYSHGPVAYAAPVAKLAYAAPVAHVTYSSPAISYHH